MLEAESQAWHRCWIFQGEPSRFDLEKGLIPEKSDIWTVNRFQQLIKRGDIVYFWRAGDEAGIYGWGEVTGKEIITKSRPPKKGENENLDYTEPGIEVT